MATWHDWQSDLLFAAHLAINTANTDLLSIMGTFSPQQCTNNPCAISHKTGSSSNCAQVTILLRAQNYPSHSAASSAFAAQLSNGQYPHLLAAFKSGNPFTVSDPAQVQAELDSWVTGAGDAYMSAVGNQIGPAGEPPAIHKGWHQLTQAVNKNFPKALHQADRNISAALRSLSKARKVKI